MKILRLGLVCSLVLWISVVIGLEANSQDQDKDQQQIADLVQILKNYSRSKYLEFSIRRVIESDLLGKKTQQEGKLHLERNRFKLDLKGDSESLVVFDGTYVWIVEDKIVSRAPAKKANAEVRFLEEIFFENRLAEKFKVEVLDQKDGETEFQLVSKDKKAVISVFKIKMKNNKIRAISYQDDLENKFIVSILHEIRNSSSRPNLFRYRPDPKATINLL